jgi:multiple sugar transport system substrate-binding protein
VPAGPAGTRATFAWHAGLHISSTTRDPALAYKVYRALLTGIQHWKIPAPRRSLAAKLAEIEPRKAAAAPAILNSMAYMRPMRTVPEFTRWRARYSELFVEPVARGLASPREAAALADRELAPLMRR